MNDICVKPARRGAVMFDAAATTAGANAHAAHGAHEAQPAQQARWAQQPPQPPQVQQAQQAQQVQPVRQAQRAPQLQAERGTYVRSRLGAAWFAVRASGLRLLRTARDLRESLAGGAAARAQPRRLTADAAQGAAWPGLAGASSTPLWPAGDGAEWLLTAGKVQNLRVAAARLHGLVIARGTVFSFWRALGRPTRRRGYVEGRELREGCMVASVGGGLCQLSNALYAAALAAGLEIVERHPHSRIVPGSAAERGLDATVFWNYVDLRLRAAVDCLLEVRLSATHLEVQLRTRAGAALNPGGAAVRVPLPQSLVPMPAHAPAMVQGARPGAVLARAPAPGRAHDCVDCEQKHCLQYIAPRAAGARSAWLLDEVWPEFDRWLGTQARPGDLLALPLDGARRRCPAYAWSAARLPGVRVIEHPALTLARGLGTRWLSAQGAARQRGLLALDTALAGSFARRLTHDIDQVVVALNLLPHLWRAGVLAGRRVTVLMNRSPLAMLHGQLDRAAALHPGSPTLHDFRAGADLVEAEEEALRAAALLVTPHQAVAGFARQRYAVPVAQLDWLLPQSPVNELRRQQESPQPLPHQPLAQQTLAQQTAWPPAQRQQPAPQQPSPQQSLPLSTWRQAPPPRPAAPAAHAGGSILFPASALGRKGAYEVRAACLELDLEVRVLGQAREQPAFWRGVRMRPANRHDPFAEVACVVLPAFVEHRPRLLLQARSRGLPVICSADCGLPPDASGVRLVRAGALPELVDALRACC